MEEKKKHPHAGHRDRLKNKALKGGIEYWPNHEVLELLLTYSIPHKDVNPLAHELIDTFGTLGNVLDADYEQLKSVKGIGHQTALFLSLLPDIFDKYKASRNLDTILMDTSSKCVNYFRSLSRVKKVEEFYVFCLDSKKRLIKSVRINGGMEGSISFSIREFAEIVAFSKCDAILVMHSHPNGDINPTEADVKSTLRLIETARTLGVKFDDHIIVSKTQYFSFLNNGLLMGLKQQVKQRSTIPIRFIEPNKDKTSDNKSGDNLE